MKHKIVITACVVALLSSFITNAQITTHPPKLHSATSRIDIRKHDIKPDCKNACAHCALRYPTSMDTEMERIISKPILGEVATRLDLATKWNLSSDEVYTTLKEKLRVTQFRNTSLISIRATSQDIAEAVAIANEVASASKNALDEENLKAQKTAQKEANMALKKQEAIVKQLKLKLQALRKEHGYSVSLTTDTGANIEKLRMEQLKNDLVRAKKKSVLTETRLKKFSEARDQSLDEFVVLLANGPFIESMSKQIQQYEKELSEKTPILGQDHLEVKMAQAALDELNKKQEQACRGILKGMEAQDIAAKARRDALEEEITKIKVTKSPELIKAQAEYKTQQAELTAQQAILEQLKEQAFMVKYQRQNRSISNVDFAHPKPKPKPLSEFKTALFAKQTEAAKANSQQERHRATSRISVLKNEEPLLTCEHPCEHCFLNVTPSSSLLTEAAIIVSRPILTKVAEKLNLAEKWALNETKPSLKEMCSMLSGKLRVKQIGDTSFIEITATSDDADEAVALANELARAYQRHIEKQSLIEKQATDKSRARMLQEQENGVRQAELKYKELRKKQGLSETPLVLDKDTQKLQLQQLAGDRIQARVAMLGAKAKLEQWSKMEKKPLLNWSAYVNDPAIKSIRSEIKTTEKILIETDPNSSAFQKERAALNALNERLKNALEEIHKQLEETYAAQKNTFEELDQKRASNSGQDENPETKRARIHLEVKKSILEALKRRISEMPAPPEKPPRRTVEIISLATEAQTSN